jgi:hypothetical protein
VLAWRRKKRQAWAYWGHSAQVPPGLHSTFRPATWPPFVVAVEPPSTSTGGPTSSSLPRLAAPPRAPQLAEVGFPCFNYGQIGHFSCECPHPRQGFAPRAPPPTVNQPKAVVRPPTPRVGRANFTTLEEIPPGEEVLTGTFFLYEHPIIILFDSVASHDFLSLACAQKAGLTLCAT